MEYYANFQDIYFMIFFLSTCLSVLRIDYNRLSIQFTSQSSGGKCVLKDGVPDVFSPQWKNIQRCLDNRRFTSVCHDNPISFFLMRLRIHKNTAVSFNGFDCCQDFTTNV